MRFEKVSAEVFSSAVSDAFSKGYDAPEDIDGIYAGLKLPKQATASSAGMDFYAPYQLHVPAGESVLVPTGISWKTEKTERGCVMIIFPRSGLGFKTGMRLANTAGIIDPDYCDAENEGHIILKITNPQQDRALDIPKGKAFAQGIIVPFMICEGAEAGGERTGGFGSTDRQ